MSTLSASASLRAMSASSPLTPRTVRSLESPAVLALAGMRSDRSLDIDGYAEAVARSLRRGRREERRRRRDRDTRAAEAGRGGKDAGGTSRRGSGDDRARRISPMWAGHHGDGAPPAKGDEENRQPRGQPLAWAGPDAPAAAGSGKAPSRRSHGAAVCGAGPPTSLHADGDERRVNAVHVLMRRDLIEVFEDEPSHDAGRRRRPPSTTPSSRRCRGPRAARADRGRIGLRCRYCKHLPARKRANLHTVYPDSLSGLYRACTVRFKRHVATCPHVPGRVRDELRRLSSGRAGGGGGGGGRGCKGWWAESARAMGLEDGRGGGIVWRPPAYA